MRTDRGLRSLTPTRRPGRSLTKSDLEFNFVLGDRIAFMNQAHWDELAEGKSLLMSRAFRTLFEEHGPRSIRVRYGMIYHKEVPVAALVVHVLKLQESRSPAGDSVAPRRLGSYRMLTRPSESIPASTGELPQRSAMICGDYFTGGFHGILLRDESALGRMWPAITTLLHRLELQEGLVRDRDFVLIKDVPSSATADTRVLRHSHYRRVESSPNMVLPLSARWKNYDDYVSQLNVRYRLSAVRAARDLVKQGIITQTIEDLDNWAPRMNALYLNVQRKSGLNFVPLPQDFLPALAHCVGTDMYRCTALLLENEMMAFSFTLKDRDTAICYCLGWDTEVGQQSPMLPSLLHAVVTDAFALGCSRVNFGRTALRAKAQLGAHPEQSELWVYHAQPELDLPMTPLLDTLSHAPYGEQATPLPL